MSDACIEAIIASFPRSRPPLSPRHAALYQDHYRHNREGRGPINAASQMLESWMHRRVATGTAGPLLELGAGTLNHLRYEPAARPYDVVEPFSALLEGQPGLDRVGTVYGSVAEIPPTNRYHRIVSVATLEHMTDLPRELATCARLLADDGRFLAGIPSEGGLLWGLAWRLSTGLSYRLRHGLDYGDVMRHEHVNEAGEIVALLRYLFDAVRVRRFPLPWHHASLYCAIDARRPRMDRVAAVLDR